MQSLPLQAKIIMSQRRIRDWYEHWDGQVYVSFSGGKDSTVLKHLVENTPGVYDVPVVFVDTGLEYPEVRKFATERADVVLRPEMRFDEVIKTYGYPVASKEVAQKIYELRNYNLSDQYRDELMTGANGRKRRKVPEKWKILIDAPFEVSKHCCDVMKKRPAKRYEKESGRKAMTGMMAGESAARMQQWMRHGCNAFGYSKRPTSSPMAFWTEQDVLEYLRLYNLPYASVYGDIVETPKGLATTGCSRTGCMFCMFGCTQDPTPNRFQRMKETHPRQYEYCMKPVEEKGLGLREVLDYIGVPYE
jgi:3'-phosphoadenosine 5'-phosphosulfate sulfotransferase (PAPS reductase)/FAD synthetase